MYSARHDVDNLKGNENKLPPNAILTAPSSTTAYTVEAEYPEALGLPAGNLQGETHRRAHSAIDPGVCTRGDCTISRLRPRRL